MLKIPEKLLPPKVRTAIDKIGLDKVYELRLRAGRAAAVNVEGKYFYLGAGGATVYREDAFCLGLFEMEQIVLAAADYSIYAVNEQLTRSFVTIEGGIRVGICGTAVNENGDIRTIKEYGSVMIRFPHEVPGCSDRIPLKETSILIVSKPACGKTTILRDLAKRYSSILRKNVVIIDERGEIAACKKGLPLLDVGDSEVMSDCSKEYGFTQAIRVLRPDVIVTDELMGDRDFSAVSLAVASGIKVLASLHADSFEGALEKLHNCNAFECLVLLDDGECVGSIKEIREV